MLASAQCAARLGRREPFEVKEFETFEDLQGSMKELVIARVPTFVFHAAAVSDYSPVKSVGKISSDQKGPESKADCFSARGVRHHVVSGGI